MALVIKDSLISFRTNTQSSDSDLLINPGQKRLSQPEDAVIQQLKGGAHRHSQVNDPIQLTLQEANLLAENIADDISLYPQQAGDAHRLSANSLSLIGD